MEIGLKSPLRQTIFESSTCSSMVSAISIWTKSWLYQLIRLLPNGLSAFQRGELEKKDTFSKRVLTTEPKFVQKRKQQKLRDKENQGIEGIQMTVSTSENGNGEKMSLVSTAEKEES